MTVRGVGVDIVEIARMEKYPADGAFARRLFSEEERAYLEGKKHGLAQSMAAMFAAKEAFAKMLGCGMSGFAWQELEVLHREDGKPYYRCSEKVREVMLRSGVTQAELSISHDGGLAVAFAVGSGPDEGVAADGGPEEAEKA